MRKTLTLIGIFCCASGVDAAITAARFAPRNCGTFTGEQTPLVSYAVGGFRDFWFEVGLTSTPRVTTSGASSAVVIQDQLVSRDTPATTVTDFQLTVTKSNFIRQDADITVVSLNPSILGDPVNGVMSYLSSGSASVVAASSLLTITNSATTSTIGGQTVDTVTNFVTGSLTKHIRDSVDALLAGKTPAAAMPVYSSVDLSTTNYTRNSSLWCGAISNLPCPSPWNSDGGVFKAGTLISRRHILFAAHYQISVGAKVRFVAADGTASERTMTAKEIMPNYTPYYPDFCVGLLDSDAPASIPFAKVLPANWASYIPTFAGTPAASLNQNESLSVRNVRSIGSAISFISPTNAVRNPFYQTIIEGDSGNPIFWIINNEFVLLSVFTSGGAGMGTSIMDQFANINTAMANLGVTNQLTTVDLSGFPTY